MSEVPVFYPTYEEFRDFSAYIKNLELTVAARVGLAKIIPPKEWKHECCYDEIENFTIPSPILQSLDGKCGYYQTTNVPKKPMTVAALKTLSETKTRQCPKFENEDDLERKYWKTVTYFSPLYGADVVGSLFPESKTVWNVNRLDSILNILPEKYDLHISGVNSSYLYFGMWKSTFAWHTEDMDLYSINYIHFGAGKTWYCVPPSHGARFENLANTFFPAQNKLCSAFLRHKTTVISPSILKKYGIPYHKTVHKAGEFMITFPYAYHSGFNHGFNCAESTNFATERWIDFGKDAKQCECFRDNVKIDMDIFIQEFQKKEEEYTPIKEETTDDDMQQDHEYEEMDEFQRDEDLNIVFEYDVEDEPEAPQTFSSDDYCKQPAEQHPKLEHFAQAPKYSFNYSNSPVTYNPQMYNHQLLSDLTPVSTPPPSQFTWHYYTPSSPSSLYTTTGK
eukprot:Nk52_evm58s215 gene=Nk52_evmTU58s215